MTQTAILQAIWGQLLTLLTGRKERFWTIGTEFCNKYFWVTGPWRSSPGKWILGLRIGLRLVMGLFIRLQHLQQKKSSRTWRSSACSSAQVNRILRHVSQMGRYGTTPGDFDIDVRSPWSNSPILIGGIGVSPASGHSGSLQVFNKRQSNSPGKIGDTQKLDNSVDRKLLYDRYYVYIFSKLIDRELSHCSITNLYSRFRMDFARNVVQTVAPQLVHLGLLTVNTPDEFGIQGTPSNIIRRLKYISHWSAPDHIFGKARAVGISAARS